MDPNHDETRGKAEREQTIPARSMRKFHPRPVEDDVATTPHAGNSRTPTEELNPDDFE